MPRGRKSLRDETVQANVINLSWTTILRALHSNKLTEEEKIKISIEVVKKTCPQKMEFSGDLPQKTQVNIIYSNDKRQNTEHRVDEETARSARVSS